ncbi:MAG: histidinol-phosphate transaminase [Flavobacteriales bacterium]|nr:histidinol-phosphate transaminase [Flavobacteriales bacterium]
MNIASLVRENIKKLSPYSSARDEYSGSEGVFLDANENPFGNLNRYPDPYQKELKKKIAEIKNIDAKNIFLGNGSDEVIDVIYRTFCNPSEDKALTFSPTYGMYKVGSEINDIELTEIPLKDNFQIDLDKLNPFLEEVFYKVIFICSPNNPTGNAIDVRDIEFILENFNGIVVVDEAYIDFSSQGSFLKKIEEYPNLIVMQTFSKAYGLANVRVGMAFTNEEILSYFNKVKPPYNISGINQKAVLDKLNDIEKVNAEIAEILTQRDFLINELKQIQKVKHIYPTDANFILVEMEDGNYTYNELVNHKIIIRNRSGVVKNCVRITVGNKEENQKLIEKLKEL